MILIMARRPFWSSLRRKSALFSSVNAGTLRRGEQERDNTRLAAHQVVWLLHLREYLKAPEERNNLHLAEGRIRVARLKRLRLGNGLKGSARGDVPWKVDPIAVHHVANKRKHRKPTRLDLPRPEPGI
eukprot:FR740057.1.p1 GENE.FR740057.1~~FR740057.1.p1  ORF type:complete len:128 (-),score=5.69 FR740057.1:127-510(-)